MALSLSRCMGGSTVASCWGRLLQEGSMVMGGIAEGVLFVWSVLTSDFEEDVTTSKC